MMIQGLRFMLTAHVLLYQKWSRWFFYWPFDGGPWVNWLVGQSVLLGMPVENWTVFTFIIGMTSFAVACRTSR